MKVIERGRLDAIMAEHDIKVMSADDVAQVAGQVGKLAGADAVIIGEVTQYEAQQEFGSLAVYAVAGSSTKHKHRVGLSLRAVNVSDSTVIYADSGSGTSEEGYSDAAEEAADEALKDWLAFYSQTRLASSP
jgi:curli biogenesis system outer membrane secretion channel CsgG